MGDVTGFAAWACAVSQATNASLAGSRLYVPEDTCAGVERAMLFAQMGAWGLVGARTRAEADFVFPEVPASGPADAVEAIGRARHGMSASEHIAAELASSGTLTGVRIACSLIVEPKTAVLLELLRDAGAEVGVYCHAHECDQAVARELAECGLTVEADAAWDPAAEHAGALRLLDALRPHLIIDDGANLGRLVALERPDLTGGIVGVAEETTSGVRAFAAMEAAGALPFPVVAVNDARLKTAFDNRHGTGETCVTTVQTLLGSDCFDGARVCVVGFGPVGEGFACRVRALGGLVTVVDTDPVAALRALYAGFDVRTMQEVLPTCDVVVSATGVRHTLTLTHLRLMHANATLVVIGGTANEIALDEVMAVGGGLTPADPATPAMSVLRVPGGHTLHLLAGGNGVNYAAGPGNPITVMDLSFAAQLCAVSHLLAHQGALPCRVLRLPAEADRHIATLALRARGVTVPADTGAAATDWRLTRHADLSAPADKESA